MILISMVRSNTRGDVGRLLSDRRRLNVAFTRAKVSCRLQYSSFYHTHPWPPDTSRCTASCETTSFTLETCCQYAVSRILCQFYFPSISVIYRRDFIDEYFLLTLPNVAFVRAYVCLHSRQGQVGGGGVDGDAAERRGGAVGGPPRVFARAPRAAWVDVQAAGGGTSYVKRRNSLM